MSLGLLSAASRICDDVNLLWSIAEVYNESTQKPRAHELLAGVLYALDKDAAPPQKKRVQPPPVLAYVDEDDDEALFASAPPQQTYDTPAPSTWRRTLADWAARACDELALFPAYQRVAWRTSRRCGLDQMVGIVPYGLARCARIVITDEHWLSSAIRAAAAHPFERAAIKLLQGRVLPVEPYRGWRVSILFACVERRSSVFAPCVMAVRLAWLCSGVDDGAPFRGEALVAAACQALAGSLVELPRAVACVCVVRLVRRALFGGSPARRGRDRRFRSACGARCTGRGRRRRAAGSDATYGGCVVLVVYFMYYLEPLADGRRHGDVVLLGLGRLLLLLGLGVPARVRPGAPRDRRRRDPVQAGDTFLDHGDGCSGLRVEQLLHERGARL